MGYTQWHTHMGGCGNRNASRPCLTGLHNACAGGGGEGDAADHRPRTTFPWRHQQNGLCRCSNPEGRAGQLTVFRPSMRRLSDIGGTPFQRHDQAEQRSCPSGGTGLSRRRRPTGKGSVRLGRLGARGEHTFRNHAKGPQRLQGPCNWAMNGSANRSGCVGALCSGCS